MFDLIKKETRAEIRGSEEFSIIRRGLQQNGYSPALASMEDALCDALGVNRGRLSLSSMLYDRRMYRGTSDAASLGEFFMHEDSLFLVAPTGGKLIVWELRSHSNPSRIGEFLTSLENTVRGRFDGRRVRGMEFEWRDQSPGARIGGRLFRRPEARTQEGRLNTRASEYNEADVNNSALLARKGIRGFLVNLAKVGNKARSADAASLLDEESRNELIGAGLIRKEYLLVCRQDSRTICSIPDRDEFESTIGQKLTCTSCGRLFVDELIQDIYALTPSARSLLEGSHWMTLWVTSLLVNSGVQGERIKWNAAAGDDELDIVAEIHGLKVFFELKDREFGLGDAYPFSFRIERYGGDVGVVVTTESVADEADKFFEEQKRRGNTVVSVVDGEKDIPQKLTSLVASLSKLAVRQSVAGAEERFGFDIWPILEGWMARYE